MSPSKMNLLIFFKNVMLLIKDYKAEMETEYKRKDVNHHKNILSSLLLFWLKVIPSHSFTNVKEKRVTAMTPK